MAIRNENIIRLTDNVTCNADKALITMKQGGGNIVIVEKYSDDIVQQVLNDLSDDESGYVFFASEIKLDPLNNCMVPKHRAATDQEINYLRSRRIPLDKLPVLKMKDPVRRWHNFEKNSIVAIERPDEPHLYFRMVA